MWDTCGIWGIGLEPDGKDIVGIVSSDVEVVCASLIVLEVQGGQLEFGDVLRSSESEAM